MCYGGVKAGDHIVRTITALVNSYYIAMNQTSYAICDMNRAGAHLS